jgi:hypothetical protein
MRRKLPLLFGATFLAFAVVACEGPEGPAGPAGAQGEQGIQGPAGAAGQDALNTCSDCHSSDATIVAIEQQFMSSPHSIQNFGRIQAGSCAMCHSSQGFVAAANGEDPASADFTGGVAAPNCRTCHQIHTTFAGDDFALTTTSPVDLLINGNTVDVSGDDTPGSNLCATCHQARPEDDWPDYTAPLTQMFNIGSTHFDLHHGPQTNFFTTELVPSFEFGVANDLPFLPHVDVSCEGCHMGIGVENTLGDVFSATPVPGGELGHNFRPDDAVCGTCHEANFNYGDVQADLMAVIDTLGTCLEAEGVITLDVNGDFDHPVVGDHPEPYVAAYLVYVGIVEDGSWGVHHPRYMPALADSALDNMQRLSTLCP